MAAAAQCAAPAPKRYQRRRPERTLWYRVVQTHLETWLELARGADGEAPPAHVERTFRRYLEYGILAHGFARAYCDECQHDFLIANSCKCRVVCSSCNTRRKAATAAHPVDHVFPPLPVRQWVLAVPKRLRYFLQRDAALQGTVLRIFLSEVERCLREHGTGCSAATRIGAVAFTHRFRSSLDEDVHFHCCVIDGVFDAAAAPDDAPGVSFHAALVHALDAAAFAECRRACEPVSCAPSSNGDGSTAMTPPKYALGRTTAASRWMARCASRAPTGPGSNALRTCARPLSLFCMRINAMPNTWSIATPSQRDERPPARARRRCWPRRSN